MQMRAELVRECPELAGELPGRQVASNALVTLQDGLLTAWTTELEVAETTQIGSWPSARLLDAHHDLSACLFSDNGNTYLWQRGQLFNAALKASAGAILSDGRSIVVHADTAAGAAMADSFRIVLLDSQARILASEAFEADQAAVFASSFSSGNLVILEFPTGQDGIMVVSVEAVENELCIKELLDGAEAVPPVFRQMEANFCCCPTPMIPRR